MSTEMNPLPRVHAQVLAALAAHDTRVEAACLDNQHGAIDYFGDLEAALPRLISMAEQSDWVRIDADDGEVRLLDAGIRLTLRRGFLDEEVAR